MTSLGAALGLSAQRPLARFVGALDGFTSGLTVCWDLKRRLLSSYSGKAFLSRIDTTGQPTYETAYTAAGSWDSTALTAAVGSNSAYVVQPYAQYGSIDFSQTTGAAQPVIVSSGALQSNGALFAADSSRCFIRLSTQILDLVSATQAQIIFKCYSVGVNGQGRLFYHGGLLSYYPFPSFGNIYWDFPDRIQVATPAGATGAVSTVSLERYGTTARMRVNGTVVFTGTMSTSVTSAVNNFLIGQGFEGNISACAIWNTCDATISAARAAAFA